MRHRHRLGPRLDLVALSHACAAGWSIVGAMIATPHMLIGAAGVLTARTVGRALAIGALTHLALDAVPQRDCRPGALALTAVAKTST